MKFDEDDSAIINELHTLQKQYNYSKIFAKIPAKDFLYFKLHDYEIEAYIPGYYNSGGDALFISKFFTTQRKKSNPTTNGSKRRTQARLYRRPSGPIGVLCVATIAPGVSRP